LKSYFDGASRRSDHLSNGVDRLASLVQLNKSFGGNRKGVFSNLSRRDFERSQFITVGFTPEQPASLEFIREALGASMNKGGDTFDVIPCFDVTFDSVLEVGITTFSGHVYNLQSQVDWYIGNGIITHNCTAIPVVLGNAMIDEGAGEEWFNKQDDATQQSILGKGAWQAYQDGKFDFSQLSRITGDDVYGDLRTVTPLKDLIDE
jgi:hypothetical protein